MSTSIELIPEFTARTNKLATEKKAFFRRKMTQKMMQKTLEKGFSSF